MSNRKYIPFNPVKNDDPVLCARKECRMPREAHSPTGHCPFKDGSGFSLTEHFVREQKAFPLTDAIESQVRAFAFLSDSIGELATDLEEICK
jgi:hypothetical protein